LASENHSEKAESQVDDEWASKTRSPGMHEMHGDSSQNHNQGALEKDIDLFSIAQPF
jgi:hypothetical protein